jgi:CelD/BcsL family acetyltransferase involved in cellulose biosynthesis
MPPIRESSVQVHSVHKEVAYLEKHIGKPKQRTSRRANDFQLVRISTVGELLAFEQDWRKLEAENIITPTVFQSFEWAKAYCTTHLVENNTDQLHILTGYQSERLVFLFPLMITSLHGLRTLQWLSEPLGQYGDVLCARGQDVSFWMNTALEFIKSEKTVDLLRLRHIRGDSLAQPFVKDMLIDAKYDERAPFLDLTAFKTENDYDARYTSTQRKRRKKIRKNLEDMGEVAFNTLQPGAESDAAISESIIEKNAWLADRGRYNRVMGCARHVEFLKTLTKAKSSSFEMITSELKAGANPVSWEIGFRYRGTHFAYITSHVHKLTDLSPGRLHMDLSQRAALAAGQKRFDLMVPYDLHKESWSSGMVDANDYYYPISVIGRIYGATYLRTLRPLVRKIYYKLSPAVLRLLQACYFCKLP